MPKIDETTKKLHDEITQLVQKLKVSEQNNILAEQNLKQLHVYDNITIYLFLFDDRMLRRRRLIVT